MNKTLFPIKKETNCTWFLFDAQSKTLGRLSTEISRVLLGKNDTQYSPSNNIIMVLLLLMQRKLM